MAQIGGYATTRRTGAPRSTGPVATTLIARFHFPIYRTTDPSKQWMPDSKTLCLVDVEISIEGYRDPLILKDLSVLQGREGQLSVFPADKYDANKQNEDGSKGGRVRIYDLPYELTQSIKKALTEGDDELTDDVLGQLEQAWIDYHKDDVDGGGAESVAIYLEKVGAEPIAAPAPPPVQQTRQTPPAGGTAAAGRRGRAAADDGEALAAPGDPFKE